MLLPPKKFLTVLEALSFIAIHNGSRPVSAKEICQLLEGVSERYLEPILQKMVHSKILRSIRGPKGGYILARERRKIMLNEIFRVVQATEEPLLEHSQLGKHVILPLWNTLEASLIQQLSTITLDDVCKKAEKHQASLKQKASDFTI
jgi:Rrf2 family iron-sulfur cluster assembly transcriptional regulator